MLRSAQVAHPQCAGMLPAPIGCRGFGRTLPQSAQPQPGFSGRTLLSILQPSARSIPTSTATAAIYEPAVSQRVSDAPQQAAAAAMAALPWLPGMLNAIGSMCQFLGAVVERVRSSVASAFPQLQGMTAQEVHVQLRALANNVKVLALVAPLARAASSESLTALYARTFERAAFGFAKMYLFCLFMRVLLSWFPGIDWNAQPWTFLRLITEPYLQIYRGILPPLFGQLDFTPLFGFLILQDVVEVMAPTFTLGMHNADTSTKWTTSDVMCYFDGF